MNLNDLSLDELKSIIDNSPMQSLEYMNMSTYFHDLMYNYKQKFYWLPKLERLIFTPYENDERNKVINRTVEHNEIINRDSEYNISIREVLMNIDSRENPVSSSIDELEKYLTRTLDHHKRRLASKTRQLSGRKVSEHGGWSLGYYEGSISSLENVLDELKSIKSKTTK